MLRRPYTAIHTSTNNMTIPEVSNRTMIKYGVIIHVENDRDRNQIQSTFQLEELIQSNWKLNVKKHKVMNKNHVSVFLPKRVKQIQGNINCQPESNIYLFIKVEYEKVLKANSFIVVKWK
jgi:hypothetical protein